MLTWILCQPHPLAAPTKTMIGLLTWRPFPINQPKRCWTKKKDCRRRTSANCAGCQPVLLNFIAKTERSVDFVPEASTFVVFLLDLFLICVTVNRLFGFRSTR